jgi:uncharacterized protein YecT (DUF1311 family)
MHTWAAACVAALALFGSLAMAQAASFECSRASSQRERLICASSELSALDEQLGAAYAAALKILSPAGADLLRGSERDWFDHTDLICGLRPAPDQARPIAPSNGFTPTACLTGATRERLQDIHRTGRFGPYVIVQVDRYAAQPMSAPADHGNRHYATRHLGYPQIDAPKRPAELAWNRMVSEHPGPNTLTFGDDTTEEVVACVGLATPTVISLQWIDYEYPYGTAHGHWSLEVSNTVMSPHPRAMLPSDLFVPEWRAHLPDVAVQAIKAETGWTPVDSGTLASLNEIAASPASWFLRTDGLELSLDAYALGCYACSPPSSLVPWTQLRALLSPKTLVP